MSKELIERLRRGHYYHAQIEQAADRIEELEREKAELMLKVTKFWCVAASYKNECDALLADNALLLGALESARSMIGHPDNIAIIDTALAKVRKP